MKMFFGSKKEKEYESMIQGTDGLGDRAVNNNTGLAEFSYSYRNSFVDGSFSCEIVRTDMNTVNISYEALDHQDYGTMEMTSAVEILDDLYCLYLKYDIARWSGYSKTHTGVLDGSGFSLSMEFNNGERLSCSGNNCAPQGYYDFEKEMREILEPYLQQMRDAEREKMVAQGVDGKLNMAMINFISHEFGNDKFEMLIRRHNGKSNNFDVRISSYSGEFIEKGKYNYYCMLPDEDIGFEKIKALIEKYDVIKWYDWNKTASNPNEAEWFQLVFDFESGSIQAMGTEHPENYDEFRGELLKYICAVIKKAEAKYDGFRSR